MDIKIKYFDRDGYRQPRLRTIKEGDWIDLYASEDVFIPKSQAPLNVNPVLINLGIAMEMPEGYEGYILPRSSTFKYWGIIMANSMGLIDNSYCGDMDEWRFPAICLSAKNEGGTWVRKGDRVCQFRIQKKMPEINFVEVSHLDGPSRGGFGSTGK